MESRPNSQISRKHSCSSACCRLTCTITVSSEALFSPRGKLQDCHRFLKRMTRQTVAISDQSPCWAFRVKLNDRLVQHVSKDNQLVTDKRQWAYQRGYSTELLLVHFTKIWRIAVDSKDMASSEVMETVNWSTIKLSYKLEIFKLMNNAYKNIFPDSLWANIFSKRDNCYSLRGYEVAAIRKYKSRFMKDSLAYRGSALWNLVNYNDKTTNVSFKELTEKRLTAGIHDFKDFIFYGTAVFTSRHRVSDHVYWLLIDFTLLFLLLAFY